MGYHIKIHIVNHCDTDVTYTGSDHTNDGEIEDGPYDAPAGKTTCVFVAKAKDANEAQGWVKYNFPSSTNLFLTINYGTNTYKFATGTKYSSGSVFVTVENTMEIGYSANEGFFVTVPDSYFGDWDTDDFDVYVHVYPSGDDATVTDSNPPDAQAQIYLDNQTSQWAILHSYNTHIYTRPTTVMNGTTSVGPGQTAIAINYQGGDQAGPTYNIDTNILMTITPYDGKPPQVTWQNGPGNYLWSVSPPDNGASAYTVTLTQND